MSRFGFTGIPSCFWSRIVLCHRRFCHAREPWESSLQSLPVSCRRTQASFTLMSHIYMGYWLNCLRDVTDSCYPCRLNLLPFSGLHSKPVALQSIPKWVRIASPSRVLNPGRFTKQERVFNETTCSFFFFKGLPQYADYHWGPTIIDNERLLISYGDDLTQQPSHFSPPRIPDSVREGRFILAHVSLHRGGMLRRA